jgi:serine protease AprX
MAKSLYTRDLSRPIRNATDRQADCRESAVRPDTLRMLKRSLFALALLAAAWPATAASHAGDGKLDSELRLRAQAPRGRSRVIIRLKAGVSSESAIRALRGVLGRRLTGVRGQVADVPDAALAAIASLPGVDGVSLDRQVRGTLERTGATIGSSWVRNTLGYDGTGVGVAILDSGVVGWHDDLGNDRVVHFTDFVNFQTAAYDDYGHGTHVAGIIAGSGDDSNGARRGIAPGASLVVLKVLDGAGQGYISNVIAAIDYAIANKDRFNIRVMNLSVAAGVYESYTSDPLTLAAKRAVDAGIVVVSAAGNLGRNRFGQTQYGGVGAPGNAPWVLTVGASSHMGTTDRSDDTVAGFSSRGPTALDYLAKPDVVAPGVGMESLTDAGTLLYQTKPTARLWGTVSTATEPYLSLSGTSMASPVVAGTVALMVQANPALTPNLVKAILEYTAESKSGYNALTEGAGFLNARGAVELANTLGRGGSSAHSQSGDPVAWSGHIIWGNHRLGRGKLLADAAAWGLDTVWGSPTTATGQNIVWGTVCLSVDCGDNIVWGTTLSGDPPPVGVIGPVPACDPTDPTCDTIVWGTDCNPTDPNCDNIVWGTVCDPTDPVCDNIVWGTTCDETDPTCDNIVWGTSTDQNVVWGTDCGGADCGDNIVWGTSTECDPTNPGCDNIVWGTALPGDNVLWATVETCDPLDPTCDNIVWGTAITCDPTEPSCDNIVWGTFRTFPPGALPSRPRR